MTKEVHDQIRKGPATKHIFFKFCKRCGEKFIPEGKFVKFCGNCNKWKIREEKRKLGARK